MPTKAKLEQVLRQIALTDVDVHVEGEVGHWVAVLKSPDYRTQPEGLRQRQVWGCLLAELDARELQQAEFVFTQEPDGAGV